MHNNGRRKLSYYDLMCEEQLYSKGLAADAIHRFRTQTKQWMFRNKTKKSRRAELNPHELRGPKENKYV